MGSSFHPSTREVDMRDWQDPKFEIWNSKLEISRISTVESRQSSLLANSFRIPHSTFHIQNLPPQNSTLRTQNFPSPSSAQQSKRIQHRIVFDSHRPLSILLP